MIIRNATHEDTEKMAELGADMHAESSYVDMSYCKVKVKHFLRAMIDQGQFVVIAESRGRMVGLMVGSVTRSWFGDDLIANDFALYVVPDQRGKAAAVRLVQRFFGWALENGAKQVRPGVSTGDQKCEAMYERLGFERVGATFVRRSVEGG